MFIKDKLLLMMNIEYPHKERIDCFVFPIESLLFTRIRNYVVYNNNFVFICPFKRERRRMYIKRDFYTRPNVLLNGLHLIK